MLFNFTEDGKYGDGFGGKGCPNCKTDAYLADIEPAPVKHTPGPWEWTNEFKTTDNRQTYSLLGKNGYGILSCDGLENSPQCFGGTEGTANAHLIAAAPDLLEALIKLRKVAAEMGTDPVIREAIEQSDAAIAKAVGK